MSDFLEFARQLPPTFFILLAVFLALFVASLALLARGRSRRPDRASKTAREALDRELSAGAADLPDLDLLLAPVPPAPPLDAEPPESEPAPDDAPAADAEAPGIAVPSVTVPPAPAPVAEAGPPPARRPDRYAVRVGDESADVADLLTVSRRLDDGSLVIQIGGRAYASPADITDATARRALVAILRELTREAPPTTAPASVPAAAPAAPPGAPAAPAAERLPRPAAASDGAPLPGDLPRFESEATPLKFRGGRPRVPVPELDIAGAIEAYLQFKLSGTPEYAGRSLHVRPSAQGGVSIEVDGRRFESVADVDDAATRVFLQAVIDEWQSRQ